MKRALAILLSAVAVLSMGCTARDGTGYSDRIKAGEHSPHKIDRVRLGPGDIADAGTTAHALWFSSGIEEGNPLFASLGSWVPLLIPAVKYGGKHAMVAMGATPRQANIAVESTGAGAACWNLGVIAGTSTGVGLGLGLGCWLLYRTNIERWEGATQVPGTIYLPVDPGQ